MRVMFNEERPTVITIIRTRLEVEGKKKLLAALLKEQREQHGRRFTQAFYHLMKNEPEKIGHVSQKAELEWWDNYKLNLGASVKAAKTAASLRKYRKKKREQEAMDRPQQRELAFLSAIHHLPAGVDLAIEYDWVSSHSAVTRWKFAEPGDPVRVTKLDITNPSNGPPPSQRAVTSLINALAFPEKFSAMMLDRMLTAAKDRDKAEAKEVVDSKKAEEKKAVEEKTEEVVAMDDVSGVEDLLKRTTESIGTEG
jgi:hypothetical protein